MKASLFYKVNCLLGEGAMWHSGRKSFFWVDIEGRTIYECRWSDKIITSKTLDRRVSLILETSDRNSLLIGVQGGLMYLDLGTGATEWLCAIDGGIKDNRTNDGGYDPAGRIWVGTMNVDCKKHAGALYCFENGKLSKKVDRMTVPNGIAWSRDRKTMYHVESEDGVVNAYDYDVDTGDIRFKTIAIDVPDSLGKPDGMCMDDEGTLWIAHWGGFGVYRWDPVTGKLLSTIEVPAANVTACTFCGEDKKSLLITTAQQGLSRDDLVKYPDSGSVFIA